MQSHRFTPYAGITYDLTPQQSLYASYTKIFKQQDNVDVTSKSVLPPLIGTNYEIGWKGSFLQGRLNASLALFVLQQKNRTVVDFGFVPDTSRNGGSFQTIAKPVGKVKSSGAELELAGELSENWRIFVGYTYNKSKYKMLQKSMRSGWRKTRLPTRITSVTSRRYICSASVQATACLKLS